MNSRAIILCIQTFFAVAANEAWAACISPPISGQAIDQFKSNPKALVTAEKDARTIEGTTRDLAGTDASLALELVRLAQGTIPRFQTAIAAGLAQAATVCVNIDQQAALLIQQAVASFQDGQFQASFAAVAGDLSTAATEAAASSATSSAGSVIIVNPNLSAPPTTSGQGGAVSSLVQLTTAGLTLSTGNTATASATAANPVSPTR